MVRTRSGKSTTDAEKKEDQKIIPPKSPKRGTKSSNKKGKEKVGFYQLFVDLCFWKPTEKTFTFWSCLFGLFILSVTGYSVYDALDTKYPDFYFFALILAIRSFDISTNLCNELLGRNHLDDVILFTESAANAAESFLFLFIVHQASQYYIAGVVVSAFAVLALNINYKEAEKIWVRFITYGVFIVCVALNYEYVLTERRVTAYFSFVFASMILDAFDFPDKYVSGAKMCEGLLIVSRSCGIYALVTAQLLLSQENQYTNIENALKAWLGISA